MPIDSWGSEDVILHDPEVDPRAVRVRFSVAGPEHRMTLLAYGPRGAPLLVAAMTYEQAAALSVELRIALNVAEGAHVLRPDRPSQTDTPGEEPCR